jgi:hypothetical protein
MAVYVVASLTIKDPAELHRLFGELGIRERATIIVDALPASEEVNSWDFSGYVSFQEK